MRPLARLMLALSTAALVLAALASSAPAGDLDPPQQLEPAAGQSFAARTPIAFTIRTFAGDRYLWLHVSRSPTVVDACGTIADEVELEPFRATGDPAVYEAKPTYFNFNAFWMNTPGTYYWQAHRIKHGSGADGCIESPVRSFTIKSGGGTTPPPPTTTTPSPTTPTPTTPTPSTKPPAPLSVARLSGEFDITTRITSSSGIRNVKRGTKDSGTWRFTPTCSVGACKTKLRIEYGQLFSVEHVARITLKKAGAVYKGSATVPLLECNFKDVRGTLSVTVSVTKGQWLDGKWRATRVTGRQSFSAPETISGMFRCPAATFTAAVTGSLS